MADAIFLSHTFTSKLTTLNLSSSTCQLKLKNDDYKGMDPEVAMADFMERVHAYEKVYQVLSSKPNMMRPWDTFTALA
jgi:6-phosphofructo-2-kinase